MAVVLDFNNSVNPQLNQVQGFLLDNLVVPVADLNGAGGAYTQLKRRCVPCDR